MLQHGDVTDVQFAKMWTLRQLLNQHVCIWTSATTNCDAGLFGQGVLPQVQWRKDCHVVTYV